MLFLFTHYWNIQQKACEVLFVFIQQPWTYPHCIETFSLVQQVELIGGVDMYQAVCRDCFRSPVKKSPRQSPYKLSSKSPKPCKTSPTRPGQTPEVLQEVSVTQLQNLTNRKLFIEVPSQRT